MVGFISEIPFSYRFATYRTAAKVRYVQRRGYLHHIDIWNVIEAFRYRMFQSSCIIALMSLLLGFSLLIKRPDLKNWISGPICVFFLYRKLPLMFKKVQGRSNSYNFLTLLERMGSIQWKRPPL